MSQYNASVTSDMMNFLNDQDREHAKTLESQQTREIIKPSTDHNEMTRNVELFDQRLVEAGINMDELQGILNSYGHTMIDAAAGAGKTTAIVLLLIRGMLSGAMMKVVNTPDGLGGYRPYLVPAKILVSTFLKTGAADLKRSFHDWCNKLGVFGLSLDSVTFSTLHAEVFAAVKALGASVPIGEENVEILKTAMRTYNIRSRMSVSRNITIDEIMEVQNIIQYARNRLDLQRYNHPAMNDYGIDSITLNNLLNDTKHMRTISGNYDFEDMNEMVMEAASVNPTVSDFLASRYDVVIIDEFQDTSQLQFEVFKHYFRGVARIIVIGDVDQIIYSWRGSDGNIMLKDFGRLYTPNVYPLSTNYRCRENILNFVKPSIEKNVDRLPKELKAFKKGGEVNIIYDGGINDLVSSVHRDLANNRTVGVIARSNASLLVPALLLEIDGTIQYSLSKSISMNSRLPKQIFGMIHLITKRLTSDFETLLRTFTPKYAWNEVTQLITVLKNNRTESIFTLPEEDLRASLPQLFPFLKGFRQAKEMGDVEAFMFALMYMERHSFNGSSVYAQNARDLLGFARQIVTEHEKVSKMDIYQLEMLFTSTLPDAIAQRTKYAGEGSFCKLTTGHEAKGKEWDSVYIWNNINGAFPVSSGNRELSPQEMEEERRLHYIACTRAKDILTIFTRRGMEGDFLKECDHSLVGVTSQAYAQSNSNREPLYRRKSTEALPDNTSMIADWLKRYVSAVLSGASPDSTYYNVLAVESAIPFDELVERLKPYGVNLTPDTADDIFTQFFFDQASSLLQS